MVEIQKGKSFDIAGKIEGSVNHKFKETDDKSVYFGQMRQPLNALKVKEICVDNLFINIAESESREVALFYGLNDTGWNIGPEMEKIKGEWRALYHVNMSCVGKTPVTVSASFVKDNIRVSFTAECPDYVVLGIDYPANAREFGAHLNKCFKRVAEGETWEDIDREYPLLAKEAREEFTIKYANEILLAQKKIEDAIMKL
jgi:hypothetical protein